jgi:hypothetical protein
LVEVDRKATFALLVKFKHFNNVAKINYPGVCGIRRNRKRPPPLSSGRNSDLSQFAGLNTTNGRKNAGASSATTLRRKVKKQEILEKKKKRKKRDQTLKDVEQGRAQ